MLLVVFAGATVLELEVLELETGQAPQPAPQRVLELARNH
jgi:hypothetical protein